MVFRVEIAPQAFEDLDSIADYIKRGRNTASAERKVAECPDDVECGLGYNGFPHGAGRRRSEC